jgi:hypothetical protein
MSGEIKSWDQLMRYVSRNFGIEANLSSVLFLIGVHESGIGFRQYSRDQKTELIKLAEYVLLSKEKFYLKLQDPASNRPVWIKNPARSMPSDTVLEKLLESLILEYFNEHQIKTTFV